jgi:hypothetical protein
MAVPFPKLNAYSRVCPVTCRFGQGGKRLTIVDMSKSVSDIRAGSPGQDLRVAAPCPAAGCLSPGHKLPTPARAAQPGHTTGQAAGLVTSCVPRRSVRVAEGIRGRLPCCPGATSVRVFFAGHHSLEYSAMIFLITCDPDMKFLTGFWISWFSCASSLP